MKKLMLFCALALLVAFVVPAAAEVQNVKVSGDIRTYGAYRNNFDLSDVASNDDNTDWINTAARLRVDADLTDNVGTTVRVINERDWGIEETALSSDGNTDVSVDLASLMLKEFLYSPLTLTIGRQELRYGNGLVVGDVDGNAFSRNGSTGTGSGIYAAEFSRRKAFDAIRAVLDFDPITVDVFHALIEEISGDENVVSSAGNSEDWTLTGVDVSYAVGDYNANVAGYWVLSHQSGEASSPTPPQLGGTWSTDTNHGREINTFGARGNIEPVAGLDLGVEIAFQDGEYSNTRDQSAAAFQANGSYTFDAKFKPVVRLAYHYFSGEEVANLGDQESWIPTFEDQTLGIIADRMQNSIVSGADQAGGDAPHGASTNMHIINLGGSIEPIDDVSLSVDWYNYTLAEENDSSGGLGATSSAFTNDDDYGDEVDVVLAYDYTEDVTFNGTFAVFSPGNAWDSDAQDTAIQGTGGVTVML